MADAEDMRRMLRHVAAIRDAGEQERFLRGLPGPVRRLIWSEWNWQAHPGQEEPNTDWRVWLMMAGRGFGKTRTGAEWVWARAREGAGVQIALVGATIEDVVRIMIEGESGLSAVARADESLKWRSSRSRVDFSTGAVGFAYSGERPGKLRGPQHHHAWCDEIARWTHPDETWDNLMLGLRLGRHPRAVVTTTPKSMPLLKRIKAMDRVHESGGRTIGNVHLPEDFIERVTDLYAGTRLGRQELGGELIEDVEGALWPRALIEASRGSGSIAREELSRVVIGVDPPAGVNGAACGIVVAGLSGETGHVLADASVAGLSPEGWATAVAAAARRWQADRVVAEVNQGGRMVESVLRAVEPQLPLKLVHASQGKSARAEPVAALFERGAVRLAGCFPELEDELAGMIAGGSPDGPGRARSPDRADAMVWALTELMLRRRGVPKVRPV
jgi:phage terminase large subunit-like protein